MRVCGKDLNDPESFYAVEASIVKEAPFLAEFYNNSVAAAMFDLFPDKRLVPWRFSSTYHVWWRTVANQRDFLLNHALPNIERKRRGAAMPPVGTPIPHIPYDDPALLEAIHKLAATPASFPQNSTDVGAPTLLDLMYTVSKEELIAEGGSLLLRKYSTIPGIARQLFPSVYWQSEKFSQAASSSVSAAVAEGLKNQRKAMKKKRLTKSFGEDVTKEIVSIGKDIGISDLSQWYAVEGVPALSTLRRRTRASLPELLSSAYPDHEWHLWLFLHPPRNVLTPPVNQRMFLDWAARQILPEAADSLSRWNRISLQQFQRLPKSSALLGQYDGSLAHALRSLYPEHDWSNRESSYSSIRAPV